MSFTESYTENAISAAKAAAKAWEAAASAMRYAKIADDPANDYAPGTVASAAAKAQQAANATCEAFKTASRYYEADPFPTYDAVVRAAHDACRDAVAIARGARSIATNLGA